MSALPDNPWTLLGWLVVALIALRIVVPLVVVVCAGAFFLGLTFAAWLANKWEARTPEGRQRQAMRQAGHALRKYGDALTRKRR